ncbi:MAG TPA: PLP-dependent aminotransferase family protein, partial [Pseudomonadales bacterium]|nr:PLP-dependent aminotransferase family protein [Pseudomonadales bacterium]
MPYLNIELIRSTETGLADQIVDAISEQISRHELAEGERLPSVRKLAAQLHVSVFTAKNAYDRLVSKGLIQARAGSGYFVSRKKLSGVTHIEAPTELPNSALGLAKRALDSSNISVPAGSGFLPPLWAENAIPVTVFSKISKRSSAPLMSSPAQGASLLRKQIADLIQQRGIPASSEQIVVTFGASQAFDLIIRALLQPGDSVLVEDPGYFVLYSQLRAAGINLVPVVRNMDGPDLTAIEQQIEAHSPKLFFTQTLLHNPTGGNNSVQVSHRLLSLAEKHQFYLVEDDVYGDLTDPHSVRLAQLDGLQRVIYISGFTKVLSAGVRLGYLAAHPDLIGPLLEQKILTVLTGSSLMELAVAEVMESGHYKKHLQKLRERLARARADSVRALKTVGVTGASDDAQGIFIWSRMEPHVNVDALVLRAQEKGI